MKITAKQYTTSKLDYKVDWASFLGSDTIAQSTWEAHGDVVFTAKQNTDADAVAFIEAGAEGFYRIANTITTELGRTHSMVFTLQVTNPLG